MYKIFRNVLLACSALTICVVLQISAFAQAKGMDVTEVTIAASGLAPETIYRQSGAKSWQVISRGTVSQTCSEANRDEWSVYLACAQNVQVVLNLFTKERSIIGTAGSTLKSPIARSSNAPVAAAQPAPAVTSAPRSGSLASPLSSNELAQVMKWISVKTSAARLPFCWRQSYGRGVGTPMVCQAGYNQETLGLCSQQCGGDERGIATFCYKNCPAGFRDDGLYCGKPAAYERESFGWQIGDPLLPNYSGPTGRCEAKNGRGNCEQGGLIIYPKCRTGFKAVADGNICSPACQPGWEDIGVSCKKPSRARDTKPVTTCAPGFQKDPLGALCYPACGSGTIAGNQQRVVNAGPDNKFKGVGPVCWQNCPSQQSFDCGAGCATSKGECTDAVFSMVAAPIKAALQITILVLSAGGSSAAQAGNAGNAAKAAEALENIKTLVDVAEEIKNLVQSQSAQEFFGSFDTNPANRAKFEEYSREFVENFSEMTSPEVEREINRRFSPRAAAEIKRQWSYNHLSMMLEANGISTAKGVVGVIAAADPTGIADVVKAFTNPICKDDTPFPSINPRY